VRLQQSMNRDTRNLSHLTPCVGRWIHSQKPTPTRWQASGNGAWGVLHRAAASFSPWLDGLLKWRRRRVAAHQIVGDNGSSTCDDSRSRHDFGPSNSENEGAEPFWATCIGVVTGAGPRLPEHSQFLSVLLNSPAPTRVLAHLRRSTLLSVALKNWFPPATMAFTKRELDQLNGSCRQERRKPSNTLPPRPLTTVVAVSVL
jgi:hypothetical protein